MNIEKDIFERYIVDIDKLLKYGFVNDNGVLIFKKNIINDAFEVIIEYDNSIKGKIIDLSFDEEYTNFRTNMSGEFNNKIKDEFEKILLDIRTKCFIKSNFIFEQSNRINKYIEDEYKSSPEFLWDKYPNYAVYRNDSNKWFAIIMDIPVNKIDKIIKSDEIIEIINVKIDPSIKEELIKNNDIYEAYHMNKKSWISLKLDDTLSDELIKDLINQSFSNVLK